MTDYYDPRDPVAFVRSNLPAAIEYAERELLITRRARRRNLDLAVSRGYCTVMHVIPELVAGRAMPVDLDLVQRLRPPEAGCGYCQSAREHARMWVPPVGPPPPVDCAVCSEGIELVLDPDGRWRWSHTHADRDRSCWTGDGAVATPPPWLEVPRG